MTSLFDSVTLAPRDPILGLTEQYNTDTRPNKVNLGIGVYTDEQGRIPLLDVVRRAEAMLVQAGAARGYLPIDGLPGYNQGTQALLFGVDAPLIASGRVLTAQALGGTGALRIGADFLKQLLPGSQVWISDPSWENHRAIFTRAGFIVQSYPYYDATTRGLDFDALLSALQTAPARTIVVLHACCHNPTGVDPSMAQWQRIAEVVQQRELVPFLDIAYQGFGTGLEEDAAVVRLFADRDLTFLVSSSFSKSFSLYGERVGALTLVCSNQEESARVLSQLKQVIRTAYSNPPVHGGAIVAQVLNTPALFQQWSDELAGMRQRIQTMRQQLQQRLRAHGVQQDLGFICAQRGMFSYSGLSGVQVDKLREAFGIYAVGTGRICVASLNSQNIDYVAQSMASVMA